MEEIIESLRPISRFLDRIQSILALDFLNEYLPKAAEDDRFLFVNKEIIKSAILATGLGIQWSLHFSCGCYLLWISWWQNQQQQQQQQEDLQDQQDQQHYYDNNTHSHRLLAMTLWTWCFYITAMCTFHLLEFYVTAFFNPTVVSSDSFLVNHSKAYTVAAIIASTEFWFRFWFFSDTSRTMTLTTTITTTTTTTTNYLWISITVLGILMVIVSQIIRSWAMMKCGESFNHYIQTQKKDNHILVTNGIYVWLRHPSYFGFYYWSIGTQLVLHNPISCVLFALAGWKFFSQRIPYEERSLIRLFGDEYYDYVMRSYVGIPFIQSIPKDKNKEEEEEDRGFQQQNGTEVELEEKEEAEEDDDKHHNGIEHEISNANDNGYDKKIN